MPLSPEGAKDLTKQLLDVRTSDSTALKTLSDYRRGRQEHPFPRAGLPPEVQGFLKLSRINIVQLVVDVLAQSLWVDGYRTDSADTVAEAAGWDAWQANKMDSRQSGISRAVFTYGTAYMLVLPGDPTPIMRGLSPRSLSTLYGEDPDWPIAALEVIPNGSHQLLKLYDSESIHYLTSEGGLTWMQEERHDVGVCPVVRYKNIEDLDDEYTSEVESLMPIQDQIDLTTFGLVVATHYQAFIQRYVIGWSPDSEAEKFKASASRLWTFEDEDVKVGQFSQADLGQYTRSRESTSQLMAVISQTPPHQLLGELVNLSAEALAAAESGHRRKIGERQTTLGEAHEQSLGLAAVISGAGADPTAQVRWRDTEARSLAQTVDALGKMAQMLGVPPEVLWERVPGITQQDLAIWRAKASELDTLGQFSELLSAQASF